MISFDKYLHTVPRTQFFPEFDPKGEHDGHVFDGIRALTYDGADLGGLHTKVFAHLGFPEDVSSPVPAMVLVHGGGGHPEDVWIRKWNERGYAAISMDTTGFFPHEAAPMYESAPGNKKLERRLDPPFAEDGYTVAPHNSAMRDCSLPVKDQWMYHAVAQVILAHNLLRADPRVDSAKIGLCGISWGGVITSVAIGYDPRFAFAVPIYGSGYLGCGHSDLDNGFRNPGVQIWFAERRFDRVRMPVLWLCWNDDCAFSLNSNSMSYLDTYGNNPSTRLSMLHNMLHSHHHGYTPEESYWFADHITRGRPVPQVTAAFAGGEVRWTCPADVKSVKLYWIDGKLHYVKRRKYVFENCFMDKDWQILDLVPAAGAAPLPEAAVGRYVEFTLADGIVLTSPYYE